MRSRSLSRADDLAARFEVSVRTIYRDIAHLQASGLPIEGAPGVGYVLRPGFDLPSLTFTHDQLDALAIGLAFVEASHDPALASAAREVRAAVQAGLPDPETRRLADAPYFTLFHAPAPPHAAALRRAVRERRTLAMVYEDGRGRRSERRVRPLALWSLPECWTFTGWCEARGDFRTFRFDRIAELTVTENRFEDEPGRTLEAFFAKEGRGPSETERRPPD